LLISGEKAAFYVLLPLGTATLKYHKFILMAGGTNAALRDQARASRNRDMQKISQCTAD